MMSKKFTRIVSLLFLVFVACSTALADDEACPEPVFTIDAFGGDFRVPNYMRLVVNTATDNSVEIRAIRKIDAAGSILLIAIMRNGNDSQRSGNLLKLTNEYELNGFFVEIYQSSDSSIGRNLYSAVIERGGDTAQVIVDSLEALDTLLGNAEDLDVTIEE